MAQLSKSNVPAKADDSHDGRYTHKSFVSPGGPGGPSTKPTKYPKWVENASGERVIVQDPDEEKAAQSGFMRLGTLMLLALLSLFAVAAPLFAQTAVTSTTLSAALALPTQGNQQTTVALASATGISAPTNTQPGSMLFVDAEAMRVLTLSGTTATVIRGQAGSMSGAHASGAVVYAGPASTTVGTPFVSSDPPLAVCASTSEQYTLRINTLNGKIWKCNTSVWTVVNGGQSAAMSFPAIGTAIASASTIAPVQYVTHVTGTTNVVTITVPTGCGKACQLVLIPDGVFATTTAGNIGLASTAVVSKQLIMTYDAATAKWYPSY